MGEILSAVEVMDSMTMEFINKKINMESPIGEYPFYLLIETSGSNDSHDAEKLNMFLETALNKHFILNGIVASEPTKVNVCTRHFLLCFLYKNNLLQSCR